MTDKPARPTRVTRADVARYSGVSDAVVSYVINDSPNKVAPATRERVLSAIKVLGYRPNAVARALSKGASEMLGMLVYDSRNPFFAQLCFSVDQAASQRGRSLLVVNADHPEVSVTDQIQNLAGERIDGLIVANILTAAERAQIAALGIPIVLINQFAENEELAAIGVDYRAGARLAVEHLIDHGHRNIAFVGSKSTTDERERGWSDALAHAGIPPVSRVHAPFSYAGGFAAGELLAANPDRPTALFASSDQIAIGLLAALHRHGLRVPEDIAVVSFDGTAEAEYCWPPLTTVAQPIDEMAFEAVSQLVDSHPQPGLTMFPTNLVVRQSCGCP